MTDSTLQRVLPEIAGRLQEIVCEHRFPGLAVGVVRDQELAWSSGFGCADLETGRKPDEHTISRVASITKTFTTTALLPRS